MPGVLETFTFLMISAQAGALGAGLSAVFGSAGFLATVATVGLSFLSSILFRPKQPKPEDVQSTIRNPTAPRQRHYGRNKVSGPLTFLESKQGVLYKVIALGTGRIDAIEEYWIDDKPVTLDAGGGVNEDPYYYDGDPRVTLKSRMGLPTETAYSELTAVFPEWDAAHRGDGVSSLFVTQRGAKPDKISEIFPRLAETQYRVVLRGSRVFNPAAGVTEWTDNAAAVIRDYMAHQDGMRLPTSLFTTTQARAGWIAAVNRAALAIPKKAGGTEDAYRIWGTYTFDERPADVLGRMMTCCDGRIVPTPDGGFTLDIGTWENPTVTIDADAITGFVDLKRGRKIDETANTIRATYLSPTHDYQATDADPWVDEADVSARGEIAIDRQFHMCPSHGQARRLMKLEAYRASPNWTGTINCNLRGLAAFGKRFVRLKYPLFGIDEVVEVVESRFVIGEGNILQGITLTLHSMPAEAYAWNAAAEEGTEPISEEVVVDRSIPVPTGFTFTAGTITVSGQKLSVGKISFNAPPSDSLIVEGRYKKVSDTSWEVIPIGEGETKAQTGVLEDGVQYEAQIRHRTITGRIGDWTDPSLKITPLANPTAPTALVSASVTAGSNLGNVLFNFTTSSDVNNARVHIYRVPAGATLDKAVHEKIIVPSNPGRALSFNYGDPTRANIIVDSGFDDPSKWVIGPDWSVASGVASKVAGTTTRTLLQNFDFTAYVGQSMRYGFDLTRTAGTLNVRLAGGTIVTSANHTTTGKALGSVTAVTGNNQVGFAGGGTFAGTVDNFIMYASSASCAPQGTWDFYAFPANASGVEGAGATPITGVVII